MSYNEQYPVENTPGNTARSLPSANTLPANSADSLDSASGLFGKPRSSGLFGKPRIPRSAEQDPYPPTSPSVYGEQNGRNPFDAHALPPKYIDETNELTPLNAGREDGSPSGSGMMLPALIVKVAITIVSGLAIAFSFSEAGYAEGSEEGHQDKGHATAGCDSLFYWLVFQFSFDLVIACIMCLALVPPGTRDTVGMLGCMGTLRLCAMAAGFHILYLSGLQREYCNQFLVTWSTILTWLGIVVMLMIGCQLTFALISGQANQQKRSMSDMPASA